MAKTRWLAPRELHLVLDVAQVSCLSQADAPSSAGEQAGVYGLQSARMAAQALHSIVLSHVAMCSLIRASRIDRSQGELRGITFCIQLIQIKQVIFRHIANKAHLSLPGELLQTPKNCPNKELLRDGGGT